MNWLKAFPQFKLYYCILICLETVLFTFNLRNTSSFIVSIILCFVVVYEYSCRYHMFKCRFAANANSNANFPTIIFQTLSLQLILISVNFSRRIRRSNVVWIHFKNEAIKQNYLKMDFRTRFPTLWRKKTESMLVAKSWHKPNSTGCSIRSWGRRFKSLGKNLINFVRTTCLSHYSHLLRNIQS